MSTNKDVAALPEFQKKLIAADAGGKDFTVILQYGDHAKTVREYDLTLVPGYVPGLTSIAKRIFEHGASQVLGDISARSSKLRDFPAAIASTDARWAGFLRGEWFSKIRTVTPAVPDADYAIVIARIMKCTEAEALGYLKQMDAPKRAVMEKMPEVLAGLSTLMGERAKEAMAAATKAKLPGLSGLIAGLKTGGGQHALS